MTLIIIAAVSIAATIILAIVGFFIFIIGIIFYIGTILYGIKLRYTSRQLSRRDEDFPD
jgi:4-hydroxybenzoate polyprenyltransferase